jgi:diaminopimelate decarboxylase
VLIARVEYTKTGGRKKFVILDSGMSQLIRPTLYEAYHFIWPVRVTDGHVPKQRGKRAEQELDGLETVDVVGPVCESSDYYGKDRRIPPVARGDLICVFSTGAYGMVMASQYNATPRPPEVLVDRRSATRSFAAGRRSTISSPPSSKRNRLFESRPSPRRSVRQVCS